LDGLISKELIDNHGYHYTLPTEAQWEYAARAGTTTPFNTGYCLSTDQANFNGKPISGCATGTNRVQTLPVASFPLIPSVGLHDMHGNVSELCFDSYEDYYNGVFTDPGSVTRGSSLIIRGGSWKNNAADCRSAARSIRYDIPESHVGFRVVILLSPP
jgi:formylglycine-generating enzyme required for sulfatase activity